MEILAASEQITKEFPAILSYLIPGFSNNFYDYVALNVKAIDQINEIFDAFKDEMSEEEKDSLMESFVINGNFLVHLYSFEIAFLQENSIGSAWKMRSKK